VYTCTEQLPPGGYPIAVKYIISIIQTTEEIFLTDRMPAKAKFSFNKSVSISFRVKDPTTTIAHDSDTRVYRILQETTIPIQSGDVTHRK
jgi:hypothetical protein